MNIVFYAIKDQNTNIIHSVIMSNGPILRDDYIEITEEQYGYVVGMIYENGVFSEVPTNSFTETPSQNRFISVGAFFDRFGSEKYNILASTDSVVQALVKDISVRKYIDLDRADLLQGLQLVQSKGFAIDPQAIVSAEIQPNERP